MDHRVALLLLPLAIALQVFNRSGLYCTECQYRAKKPTTSLTLIYLEVALLLLMLAPIEW